MRTLAMSDDVWHAILLRLPTSRIPNIAPSESRDDTNYRKLAIKAFRSYCIWLPASTINATPTPPRPSVRFGPRRLPAGWRHQTIPVPGTNCRYLIEFRVNSFHCFDIEEDKLLSPFISDCTELLGYGLEFEEATEICVQPENKDTKVRVAMTELYPNM